MNNLNKILCAIFLSVSINAVAETEAVDDGKIDMSFLATHMNNMQSAQEFEAEDIFPEDMKDTFGIYPLSFETVDDASCRCKYVVKNTTNSTIEGFRASVIVKNESTQFYCDIGVGSDKIEPGEIQVLSNLVMGSSCGTVETVTFTTAQRCKLSGSDSEECPADADIVLLPSNGVSWKPW